MGPQESTSRKQKQLWLVPSEGEARVDLVADVVVESPVATRVYSYSVPAELADSVRRGTFVRVPFGHGDRTSSGVCVDVAERRWKNTRKSIVEIEPGPAWLSRELIELGLWVSEYYACSPWSALSAMFPAAIRRPRVNRVVYVRATGESLPRRATEKQSAILAALAGGACERRALLERAGASTSTLRTLEKHGVVVFETREVPVGAEPWPIRPLGEGTPQDALELTRCQQDARDAIVARLGREDAFRVFLLFGPPGSGKTEVYVRAIRAAVASGRQAVLLIPEIALATQVVDRLTRRFERVAVLHSQLTDRQRQRTLDAIAAGEVDVVIGTRTAAFAPCPRIGLIVVDEEQEGSFKNLATPLYHARDVAIKRAQLQGIPVVLGSATPSLETWHNVQQRAHFELLRLPERVPGAVLPRVQLVPAEAPELGQVTRLISAELSRHLRETLEAGQQAILLHNRRGYAFGLRCGVCGMALSCERCGAQLVYHQPERQMKCHRCGWKRAAPSRCLDDTCGGKLQRSGAAIQRLATELRDMLPDARVLRLDSDTMRRRDDYREALSAFERGEADVLLGTQMIAKGLDFPRVQLVGVIDADAALSLPDFRAAERVFQLLVQVVGRAGRKSGPSIAVVQTSEDVAPVLRHALRMDYEAFASEELASRQRLGLPPLTRMVRIVCSDERPGRAKSAAEALAEALSQLAGRVDANLWVSPAERCVIARLREMARFQVTVRGTQGSSVQRFLARATGERLFRGRARRVIVDVDPLDLL